MNATAPAVSIVIPCRNEKHHIEACVESILSQKPPDGDVEIIIADGMSDDGTRGILEELAKRHPGLRVIENPARITSSGLNSAIRAARGNVIIRMDAHTKYATDYLQQCLTVLRETGSDNVGGPWVAQGKGLVGRAIAAAFQSRFSTGGSRGHDPNYEGPLDSVYLGCWRREVFDRIGFFDEALVRNQDDEFNLRLVRAGGKIWQSPRIKSWYCPRESLRALCRQYAEYGYWKVRVIQKHTRPASLRHLIPGVFALALAALALLSLWWPLSAWAWIGLVGMYAVCSVIASVLIARRQDWNLLPLLPVVFACYHLAFGYGFLRGIWSFIILRRTRGR